VSTTLGSGFSIHAVEPASNLIIPLCGILQREMATWRMAGCCLGCVIDNSVDAFSHLEPHMSWNISETDWTSVKGKIKSRWGKMTEAQLVVIAGKREDLASKLQEHYAITAEEAENQIKSFEGHTKELRPKKES